MRYAPTSDHIFISRADLSKAMRTKSFKPVRFQPSWSEGLRSIGMKIFILEGMAAVVMHSMTAAFLSVFALALGGDAIYIGLLSAVPMMLWTAALLPAGLLCQRHIKKRKAIVVGASLISRMLWLPIILIALLAGPSSTALALLMIFVVLSTFAGAFFTPAWASLVGDLVPEHIRGRYFSRRNAAITAASLSGMLAAGWMLDAFGKHNPLGFAVVFSIGLAFGLLATALFSRIPNPPAAPVHEWHARVIRETWSDTRFRTFLVLFGLWQFGVMMSAPFFNVFLVKTLNADYIWVSILAVVAGLAGMAVLRGWGVFSDRFGHRVMIVIAAFGAVPAVALWIFATDVWFLVPVEIFSGVIWAGFGLAHYNYMLEISPRQSRAVYVAMFSVVLGLASILGPIAGGFVADHFVANTLFGLSEFRVVFLLTALIRLVSGLLFFFFLKEVVEKRELVHPGYVFVEMLKYGVQGSILKLHAAAGGFTTAAKGLKRAAKIAEKEAERAFHNAKEAIEYLAVEADRVGQKIAESGIELPAANERKETRKERGRRQLKKLRVKVEE